MSRFFLIAAMTIGTASLVGCRQETAENPAQQPVAPMAGEHSGWWCIEHGVPEEVCSMCSAKAAADFKQKGDWCDEHNRAQSQCFICDPSQAEKYAKLHEAKYGKKPPQPTE